MKLILVRHGQTGRNISPEFIGQSPDEKLSELGIKQANLLREYMQKNKMTFKEVYCSPYKRAIDTCRLALPDQMITMVDELREYSTGEAQDKKRSEMVNEEVLNQMMTLGMHFSWPKGETLFEVEKRAASWLYSLVSKYKDDYVNIAAFSHGMLLKCLLHYIFQFNHHLTWRVSLDNTSISVVEYKLDHWFLKSINTTPHLTQEMIT